MKKIQKISIIFTIFFSNHGTILLENLLIFNMMTCTFCYLKINDIKIINTSTWKYTLEKYVHKNTSWYFLRKRTTFTFANELNMKHFHSLFTLLTSMNFWFNLNSVVANKILSFLINIFINIYTAVLAISFANIE